MRRWILGHQEGPCRIHPDSKMKEVRSHGYVYRHCQECHRAYRRDYENNRRDKRKYRRETHFGYYPLRPSPACQWALTRYRLWAEQGQKCAICERSISLNEARLDHDHECCTAKGRNQWNGTGWCGECHREVLCNRCNSALGWLEDSIPLVQRALHYLERHAGTD